LAAALNHPLFVRWTEKDLALLREAYTAPVSCQIGLSELAKRLGRLKSNVSRKARELGLSNIARPKKAERKVDKPKYASEGERKAAISKSRREWIAKNGHPRGAAGLRHSAKAKKVIGEKAKAIWERMTDDERAALIVKRLRAKRESGKPIPNVRGSWKAGWREIGGRRIFFRSRWEANYARYLEWLRSRGEIQSWEHEPHTFWFDGIRRGCVSYLPDFRVTEAGGTIRWHEVKGWMDARSKTVLDRMAKYHPAEVIVLIREKQYEEIRRKVGAIIKGWE
jgi:hypothetical protein